MVASDIVVHPSLKDLLSQSLIETLMMKCPIIATDISGASDTLDGGKYIKLVKPADSKYMQKALEETIENLDLARDKAKDGKDYLLEHMSASRVTDEYLKVYKKVINS